MRRYVVAKAPDGWPDTLPFRVGWEGHDKDYAVGDEFEAEWDSEDEQVKLSSGVVAVVPCEYLVVGPHRVLDTEPGEKVTAALSLVQEEQLVGAGHLEIVEAAKPKPRKKKADKE